MASSHNVATRLALGMATLAVSAAALLSAQAPSPPPTRNSDWVRAYPPFRMIGNVYWVGTYDLSTYLITTRDGHLLVNTGFPETVSQIAASVAQLGFKMADVKILTATHGHGDHVAGLAELKRLTKAQMLMSNADADLLESGGRSDFRFGEDTSLRFEPVTVDRRLKDGDRITLGEVTLTAHHHPGHTKGATSFTLDVIDGGKTFRVGIMNMGSINPGVTVTGMKNYPAIGDDYARTFKAQKVLQLDVFFASHAAQFRMHEKYKPGDPYSATRFVDPEGYRTAVERLEKTYVAQLAKERQR
jgi:metallo-beta-lactamase class B